MTKRQIQQFNAMRRALINISKGYQTPKQLRKDSERDYGLDFDEAIEMAYENIQEEARVAVKSVRAIKNNENNR